MIIAQALQIMSLCSGIVCQIHVISQCTLVPRSSILRDLHIVIVFSVNPSDDVHFSSVHLFIILQCHWPSLTDNIYIDQLVTHTY